MRHTYSESERFLLRRALRRGSSSATLMQQAKAIEQLVELEVPVPLDRVKAELEAIIGNDFGTYQAGQAAAKASKLLAIANGEDQMEYPSSTPFEFAEDDAYWPYDVRPARHQMEEFRIADQAVMASQGERDFWRQNVEGEPPWSKNAGIGRDDDGPPDDLDDAA